ncbi:MAG: nucleotidyltransferase domain-containing protein [Nanoarchaeota archaeon]|nr:nucleotidyltransferase domain-containing protein [Nanoarchaeota archaeon]MBU1052134.1 nucleotidyltransferase domain-containing protein [Nanoarchaeota archaeon]MBU1987860.1 nucleotidyltransferase domain-containing protein [Nanoarchaeota archaeon]
MEQKDYRLEIILELLRKRGHARDIAKRLETNHMNVVRKLKILEKENIADFNEEGKNKTYFLKGTIEARAYAYKAENYKLIKLLAKHPSLRSIVEKIQKKPKIKLAVLFGSYAKDIPKQTSDIDIYIETTDKSLKNEIKKADTRLNIKIGKYNKSNLLIKEIEKNHIILKGVERYYEKSKFFN